MWCWKKKIDKTQEDIWQNLFSNQSEYTLVISKTPKSKSTQLEVYTPKKSDANHLLKEFGGSMSPIKNQNWQALAPPPLKPLIVRNKIIVLSTPSPAILNKEQRANPNHHVISIPPDMAFGTGHHPTTASVLGFIHDIAKKYQKLNHSWTMADFGSGSGILAIAAEKLGATKPWGFDFDALAVKVSKTNLTLNQTKQTVLVKKDLYTLIPSKQYDLVAANIFFDILIDNFPKILASVKPNGHIIVSGILKQHAQECLDAGTQAGIQWLKVIHKGKWVSALGSNPCPN
jgi:ribosomal protein L11 methyltransferase